MASCQVPVICVDDIHRLTAESQVPLALEVFLKESKYKLIETKKLIEGYLIHVVLPIVFFFVERVAVYGGFQIIFVPTLQF